MKNANFLCAKTKCWWKLCKCLLPHVNTKYQICIPTSQINDEQTLQQKGTIGASLQTNSAIPRRAEPKTTHNVKPLKLKWTMVLIIPGRFWGIFPLLASNDDMKHIKSLHHITEVCRQDLSPPMPDLFMWSFILINLWRPYDEVHNVWEWPQNGPTSCWMHWLTCGTKTVFWIWRIETQVRQFMGAASDNPAQDCNVDVGISGLVSMVFKLLQPLVRNHCNGGGRHYSKWPKQFFANYHQTYRTWRYTSN